MALFVASAPHLYRLVGAREASTATFYGTHGQALLPTEVVHARLRSLSELERASDADLEQFLTFMQRFDFCFPIESQEQVVRAFMCVLCALCVYVYVVTAAFTHSHTSRPTRRSFVM